MTDDEIMKLWRQHYEVLGFAHALMDKMKEPKREPVAYDKTEINCFAQDLYDQKMREGKRGHYESMFHVIHQCIKKVSPRAQRTWVSLTDEEIKALASWWPSYDQMPALMVLAKDIQNSLKEKNT